MSAAMSSAISRMSIGRSMSAVRPCPCRSTAMTWWCSASVGQDRPEHLARAEPAVQQDHRPPGAVDLVVEVDAVDVGVLAGALDPVVRSVAVMVALLECAELGR